MEFVLLLENDFLHRAVDIRMRRLYFGYNKLRLECNKLLLSNYTVQTTTQTESSAKTIGKRSIKFINMNECGQNEFRRVDEY